LTDDIHRAVSPGFLHHEIAANLAFFPGGLIPGQETAFLMILAYIKGSAFFTLAHHDRLGTKRTIPPDLFIYGICIAAGRETGASDKFAVAPVL
jgi:hypothetical protein